MNRAKRKSSNTRHAFVPVKVSRRDYQRLQFLIAAHAAVFRAGPVKAANAHGHSQLHDFCLLWQFVVVVLCRYSGEPLYRLEPNGNTLKGAMQHQAEPQLATLFSFLQQFQGAVLNEKCRAVVQLFHMAVARYLCLSAGALSMERSSARPLLMALLAECFEVEGTCESTFEAPDAVNT